MRNLNGPPLFETIPMAAAYNRVIGALDDAEVSPKLALINNWRGHLLAGEQNLLGVPFAFGGGEGGDILLLKDEPVSLELKRPLACGFLVFVHAADFFPRDADADGFIKNMRGDPILGDKCAEYRLTYSDGAQASAEIKRRVQINEFKTEWGEYGLECWPHTKPVSFKENSELFAEGSDQTNFWGRSQTRAEARYYHSELSHWLYAYENPFPEKEIARIDFLPAGKNVFVFGVTAAFTKQNPLRWDSERRISLPSHAFNEKFDAALLDVDMGVIVSAYPEKKYLDADWENDAANNRPEATDKYIIEYTAHLDAAFYYGGEIIDLMRSGAVSVNEPSVTVAIKTVDADGAPVPVKLHMHGEHGEYLPPMDRHRRPNPFWFEDYGADYAQGGHFASYIDGEVRAVLPLGEVYLEVTKGFEIKPVKQKFTITPETTEIAVTIERVLPWRKKGWVSADTHVHFLSPKTAELEGSAEGVNVVNLLASQWGELFTNVGDFDGRTTFGSAESGGDGEYLVRVGTENRQPVLGHISLLGYEGSMILPLTSGGPGEARVGDAVDSSLSLWARECKKQNGLVVIPHFPRPRAENAASIVLNLIDAIEVTDSSSFGSINPYALSDWYRYLNCGFHVPAVGGTDKMSASMALGAMRTYALIKNKPFTYGSWKEAVISGLTFVTTGPLVDFTVNGLEAGSAIKFDKDGGTLDVNWQVSSVTTPVSRVELIYGGEVVESKTFGPDAIDETDHYGSGSIRIKKSGWIALRAFGKWPGRGEAVAAHTSAVMVKVGDAPVYNRADAMSILEQIEGAATFVKTIAPRKDERAYAEIIGSLTSAHRKLHNMMHANNVYHDHAKDYGHHES